MNKKLKSFRAKDKRFWFSYEINPLTKEFDPHIWIRHLIEPKETMFAWFKITNQDYNEKYDRYEAYSEEYNLTIYYAYMNNDVNEILIISSFR